MVKKQNNILVIIILIFFICGIITGITLAIYNSLKTHKEHNISGVWWWDNRLDESYLDFAYNNNINEIYYYTSVFTDKTSNFIKKASNKNIKVFWLTGNYEWIEDSSALYKKINDFTNFQTTSIYKFAGIHFDIEPHQHPDFEIKRQTLITDFINLTYNLKNSFPDFYIEYDIPIWLNDEIKINNTVKPAYAHIIDNADRVTLMSYRDSYSAIYDSAKDEIEYALSIGRTLNLGVETGKNEDDFVTFYEEGKKYMYGELEKLKKLLPDGFGISVHHIKSWRELRF